MSFEIGKNIETEEPLLLDVKKIVAGRTYIASETRFGKSHTARRIVEEILENWVGKVGVVIIDPEGEYASLREKYQILIIGRDIPIQVETPTLLASTAAFMAQQVLETGISIIIDISVVDPEVGKDYVDAFLRRFFHLQTTARKLYLVLLEEGEDFAPESGSPGTRTCLEISINLARRGEKRGIGVIYVGHRPAWISKGILSQTPNKALGRIEQPDMDALERIARIPHNIVEKLVPKTNEQGDVVGGLEKGVFCFTGDWVKKTVFVKVGPVKTTHLGATPEIIPRPIGEVQGVIENMQNKLSQVIEKAKPAVASQAELENKIKTELENKYKGRIETLERTAVERAERKLRPEIDKWKNLAEQASRAQALQPTAPIPTDVLEHPIVKTRMVQLDDRARDLLTFIEREPGHTREELAARMASSKDVVSSLVDRINRVFQLQVVVDDGGRPLRYKSMLKRLFLTDVAKREIEELGRLQERNKALEEENKALRPIAEQSATLRGEVEHGRRVNKELGERLDKQDLEMKQLKERNEALAKENEAYHKIKEGFVALGITAPTIDEEKIKAIAEKQVKDTLSSEPVQIKNLQVEVEVEKKIEAMVKQEVSTQLEQKGALLTAQKQSGVIPTSVELEHKVTHFDFKASEEHVKADTTTLEGRIIYLITKGFFEERHNRKQVVEELSNNGWIHDDKEVDVALLQLCQKGIFYRKISTGNILWYWLQPEAKERIHE